MTSTPQKQRIVMLGASGKLGRMMQAIWRGLAGDLYDFIPVYRTEPPPGAIRWAPGDAIGDFPQVDGILALWGVTGTDPVALQANRDLAEAAITLGAALGARRVLHCSSAAVYHPGPDLDEHARTAPVHPYGVSKLAMESRVLEQPQGQVLLRIGNVAGAESLFGAMQNASTVHLDRFADGSAPRRSYIAPQTLLQVMLRLLQPDAPCGPVNVAAPMTTAMDELALAAGRSIVWREAPDSAMPVVGLNTDLLTTLYPMAKSEADADFLLAQARATGCWS